LQLTGGGVVGVQQPEATDVLISMPNHAKKDTLQLPKKYTKKKVMV